MWSGLCRGESWCQRRCRRTEYLHCDPGTLQLWRTEDLRRECWLCCDQTHNCHCNNPTPKIYNFDQIYIHPRSHLCWHSCRRLRHQLHDLHRPTPPPSNTVQSDSLHWEPDYMKWTCLGDQNKSVALLFLLLFCSHRKVTDVCKLCLDPLWVLVNILRSQLWSCSLVVTVKHPLQSLSVRCLSMSLSCSLSLSSDTTAVPSSKYLRGRKSESREWK